MNIKKQKDLFEVSETITVVFSQLTTTLLAGKKVGGRLCRTKLSLEIFWQENNEAADDRNFTADAEARDNVDRVRH